ncbi:hypothetical protein [Endozoicomonas lisbonensis]|uniref:ESPR domain-containing protein n=1 Tax=Endozoicomonas lisbonensis TaxID=3120522 RepID=A0ABV2SH94_9GAMM
MKKNQADVQQRQSRVLKQLAFLTALAGAPNWNSQAEVIQLDNSNFVQYLNADQPVNGTYQLSDNIDLSRYAPWKPVGNASTPLTVTLDGNYRIISGLNVATSSNNTASGLFGMLLDSQVRQIILRQPQVSSSGPSSPTGALVGELWRSRVEEIVNFNGTVTTTGDVSDTGGITGKARDNSVVRNTINTGSITAITKSNVAGISGSADQQSSVASNLNEVSDMTHFNGKVYLTGKAGNHTLIGLYLLHNQIYYSTKGARYEEELGQRIVMSPDGKKLYVAGVGRDGGNPYSVFVRQ